MNLTPPKGLPSEELTEVDCRTEDDMYGNQADITLGKDLSAYVDFREDGSVEVSFTITKNGAKRWEFLKPTEGEHEAYAVARKAVQNYVIHLARNALLGSLTGLKDKG